MKEPTVDRGGLRLERVRSELAREGLAALVVFDSPDIRYLTGFTGEATCVCVSDSEVVLLTDARFTVQAAVQAPLARTEVGPGDSAERLLEVAEEFVERSPQRDDWVLGVDSKCLMVDPWDRLRSVLDQSGIRWRLVRDFLKPLREKKYPDELQAMRASGALVVRAFEYLESLPVIGRSEREVALDLEVFLRRNGSEGVAFPFIVAAGERGAMPHAEPSDAIIEPGQLLVFDIGAVVKGYASDITRTYSTGDVSEELVQAYEAVREAQALAVAAIKPGMACSELDSLARSHLQEAGLAEYFVHSLGHGVGLEVHESPTVSQRSQAVLEPGMVVTIEPGVYLPGKGGIRIEDTVAVGGSAGEVLTEWPRELRVLH